MSDLDNVKATFSRISKEGFMPNVQTYATVISAFRQSDVDPTEYWLKFSESISVDLDAYNAIIKEFCELDDLINAKRAYGLILADENIQPNNATYDILLTACIRMNASEFARVLYLDMTDKIGLTPSLGMFKSLMRLALQNQGILKFQVSPERCRLGLSYINDMKKMRVAPTVEVYNMLLLAHRKDPAKAREIYDDMNRAGVLANKNTFKSLIKVYKDAQNVDGIDWVCKQAGHGSGVAWNGFWQFAVDAFNFIGEGDKVAEYQKRIKIVPGGAKIKKKKKDVNDRVRVF
jgi:hypothetical protein